MKASIFKYFLWLTLILIGVFAQAQEQVKLTGDKKYKIAAIVPLSGEHASMGKNMLGAMKLALLDLKTNDFDIVPIDSELEESKLRLQLTESKLNAIIGPVFAKDARKIMPILTSGDTCVISFSNDRDLSSPACLVLLGFMPEESISKVVGFAAHKNYQINALLPDNKYGLILARRLLIMSNHKQIDLGEILFYKDSSKTDPNIANLFARLNSSEHTSNKALLIPENAIMPQVIPHLSGSKIKVLGSSQFEDEKLLKAPELQGSWFASAPRKYRERFEKKFTANFDTIPLKISSLAYDAIAFSYAVISSANGGFKHDSLMNPAGFYGITGAFRFMPDGSNQRQLSVFEINAGKYSEIEPAKIDFN